MLVGRRLMFRTVTVSWQVSLLATSLFLPRWNAVSIELEACCPAFPLSHDQGIIILHATCSGSHSVPSDTFFPRTSYTPGCEISYVTNCRVGRFSKQDFWWYTIKKNQNYFSLRADVVHTITFSTDYGVFNEVLIRHLQSFVAYYHVIFENKPLMVSFAPAVWKFYNPRKCCEMTRIVDWCDVILLPWLYGFVKRGPFYSAFIYLYITDFDISVPHTSFIRVTWQPTVPMKGYDVSSTWTAHPMTSVFSGKLLTREHVAK